MKKQIKESKTRTTSTQNESVEVIIPDALKSSPLLYSGGLGVFGIGGGIERLPEQRDGFPPSREKKPDIPEATKDQYIQLIKQGNDYGIKLQRSGRVEADSADGGN